MNPNVFILPLTPETLARAAELGFVGTDVKEGDLDFQIVMVYGRNLAEVKINMDKLGLGGTKEQVPFTNGPKPYVN